MGQLRDILVTTALPYANGEIHLGHVLEYVQADIWVRFQRLLGNRCLFLCGDDAHGTPIMLSAQKAGITPEALIKKIHAKHSQDFQDFFISLDNFYTSHSPENLQLVTEIYQKLKDKGDILCKTITQAYDPEEKMFLPDRFIRGTCPRCKTQDQYGDNCEQCGATYNPTDLIEPKSALSGATPIEKETEHFFFKLENYQDWLKKWINNGHLQPQVANKLKEWFSDTLRPWDITRDAPYFGFEIPGAKDKYFYVWLDAPVGYMASTLNFFANDRAKFEHYWAKNATTELYHFVGKDIMYFHALFWPAILEGSNYRLPNNIFVHGYLTINGEKMSKSRGTFITARQYLKTLNPEFLRYYYAAKLTPQAEDLDLNLEDFALRTNADLVGKYVNLASRSAGFIKKKFNGELSAELDDPELYQDFVDGSTRIAKQYEELNYNKAVREIMQLADRANQYVDQQKPWVLAKDPTQAEKVQAVCTQALNLFKILTTYLKPILPITAKKVEDFLNSGELNWKNIPTPLLNHRINPFTPLLNRITEEALVALVNKENV